MAITSWNRCFLCSVSLSKRKCSDDDRASSSKLSTSTLPFLQNSGHKMLLYYLLNDFQERSNVYQDIVAFVNSKECINSRNTSGSSSALQFCNGCEHISKCVRDLHSQLEVIQMKIIEKVKVAKKVVINNSRLYGTNLKVKEDLEAFENYVDCQEKLNFESITATAQITRNRKLLELLHNFQTHIFEQGTQAQNYPLVYLERYTGGSVIQGSNISTSIYEPSNGQIVFVKKEPTDFPSLGVDTTEDFDSILDDDMLETDYNDDPDWEETVEIKREEKGANIGIDNPELPSTSQRKGRKRKTQQEEKNKSHVKRSRGSSHKLKEKGTIKVNEKVKSIIKKESTEDKEAQSAQQSLVLTEAQKIAAEMKLERKKAAVKKLKETLKTLVRDKEPKLPKGKRRKRPRKEQYSCEECSFQCSKTPQMEQHLREHETPEKTLKCPDCNKEFSQKQYWDFHIYVYCGATNWKCDTCYETLHGGKMKEHYENCHDGKVYTCDFCDYCFGTYHAYLHHTSVNHPHTEISFQCTFCPPEESSKMYTRIDLLRHLHEAHNQTDNAFVCDYPNCSKVYYNLSSFGFHKQTHDPISPSCNICGKTYAQKGDVDAHILFVHKKEGPHKCDKCSEVFMSTTTLISHKRQKHGLDKLKCELCPDKEYSSRRGLTVHMMVAHGVGIKQKFSCETCGKEFLTQALLERHKPVHLETKNFTCEICGFATKSIHWLQKHKRARHDAIKRHSCPYCPKMFVLPAHLKEHIRTHTKEKPFQCETCGQAFSQQGSLLLHKKKLHLYQVGRTKTAEFSKNIGPFASTGASGGDARESNSNNDVKSSTTTIAMLSESEDVEVKIFPTF